jgi:hypothetical protein
MLDFTYLHSRFNGKKDLEALKATLGPNPIMFLPETALWDIHISQRDGYSSGASVEVYSIAQVEGFRSMKPWKSNPRRLYNKPTDAQLRAIAKSPQPTHEKAEKYFIPIKMERGHGAEVSKLGNDPPCD